jgi:hypothetical protein
VEMKLANKSAHRSNWGNDHVSTTLEKEECSVEANKSLNSMHKAATESHVVHNNVRSGSTNLFRDMAEAGRNTQIYARGKCSSASLYES